ncbi:hypothetical protein KSF_065610 [Reticulibacter mediterranei]|uniref:Uncharacterized protein n=1 Tax=Reticulibacter mediterranei TaxID=2778369 RepID=A0A8J3IM63_9CHLR|nr:hypothetical protein KSF_065610 [Reticulibacter mediterranei]
MTLRSKPNHQHAFLVRVTDDPIEIEDKDLLVLSLEWRSGAKRVPQHLSGDLCANHEETTSL